MAFSAFLKSNRKLICWLSVVILLEVGFLLIWGVICYKSERFDAESEWKEFIELMNQKEQEGYDRHVETQRLFERVHKLNQEIEELTKKVAEPDAERRFQLARLILQYNRVNDFQFPDLHNRNNKSGYWDIFPRGHPYGPKVNGDIIIKSPRALFGKPIFGMDRDFLLRIEESGAGRRDPGDK